MMCLKALKQETESMWLDSLFQRVITIWKKIAYIEEKINFLYNFKLLFFVFLAVLKVRLGPHFWPTILFINLYTCIKSILILLV